MQDTAQRKDFFHLIEESGITTKSNGTVGRSRRPRKNSVIYAMRSCGMSSRGHSLSSKDGFLSSSHRQIIGTPHKYFSAGIIGPEQLHPLPFAKGDWKSWEEKAENDDGRNDPDSEKEDAS